MYKVKFLWVENGSEVSVGKGIGYLGVSAAHKLVGFKPAPGRKVGGWLVILVNTNRVYGGAAPKSHKPKKAARA